MSQPAPQEAVQATSLASSAEGKDVLNAQAITMRLAASSR